MPASPWSTGCSRAGTAGGSCCASTTPTASGRSPRSRPAIREDLSWLGLGWDAEFRQSSRAAEYEAAFARLREAGRVYPCYETPEELAATRKRQQARGAAAALRPAGAAPGRGRAGGAGGAGRRHTGACSCRMASSPSTIWSWGRAASPPSDLGDPVLRREDGSATYLFASAVDDAELGISHVIRGEDHVSNTALQLAILAGAGSAGAAVRPSAADRRCGGPAISPSGWVP